ncbi:MAG: hypothetical protein M1126_04675 [Candidatus Thermoplasmatota archaeon]|nr:hypothetical protein [Candidatus Thermoplasmatota archaeon]
MVFQATPWDCERTQVFNVMAELLRRSSGAASPRDVVFSCFNGTVPTPVGGKAGWFAKLAGRIAPRFEPVVSRPDGTGKWANIIGALQDENTSFPVISVSKDYWGEVDSRPKELGDLEHALVLLSADKADAVVFDCYLNRICSMGHCKLPLGRSIAPRNAVVEVPVQRLFKYWEGTSPPRFYFYVRRVGYRATSLAEFDEGIQAE